MHGIKTYPPRVTMSVYNNKVTDEFTIPVTVAGCAVEGQLDSDLWFRPEGMT